MESLKYDDAILKTLKQLKEEFGIELLEDTNKLNALLMDLNPESIRERKLIITVLKEGAISKIKKITDKDKETQNFEINKYIKQLITNIWITEEAAKYVVEILAKLFEINFSITNTNNAISESTSKKTLTKEIGLIREDTINYVLKSCEAVGYKAFSSNILIENITLPNSIKYIYPKSFLNCINLKSINIPEKIEKIGPCAFEGCVSLEEITISDNSNYVVQNNMLIDKKNKKILRVENKATIDEIIIPNGITRICKKAFDYSKVKRVNIPKSIENIEANTFHFTMNLEKINVDTKNLNFKDIDGVLHNKKGTLLIKYPQGKPEKRYYIEDFVEEINSQAFSFAINLENITFMNTLKKIGTKAFEYCFKIDNLILPHNIEIIEERAFQYCENLKNIILSNSIREIDNYVFYNCSILENLNIPRNVERIGDFAFANCNKLKKLIIQDGVKYIGNNSFLGCKELEISIKNNEYVEKYCQTHKIKYKKL